MMATMISTAISPVAARREAEMSEKAQYVTLGVASELLATPVERVQEILEMRPISRLPHAPAGFLGMIDVRSQGVPVVDLRVKLGFEPAPDTENTRIVVLTVRSGDEELTLGLKADRVFEVTVLDEDHLDPPPRIGSGWTSQAIAGIGRRNGAFVTVLDLEGLFATADMVALSRNAA
jgi:purine-binding chemotaxis protein CheW